MKELVELFYIFFKIGLFTFGGGYAMIPMLKSVLIEKKKWISEDEMLEVLAVAESTPGPAAINMATYLGYKRKGVLGSLVATLGVSIPSVIIIILISLVLDKFKDNLYVSYAFKGINAAVAILIVSAGLSMARNFKKNVLSIILFIIVLLLIILINFFNGSFSSIYYILIGIVLGIILYLIERKKDKKHA